MHTSHQKVVPTPDSAIDNQRPQITEWRPANGKYLLKPWQAYLFAMVVTVATLGVRLALAGPLGGQPALVMFTVPIMLSAYAGGLSAGLLATGMSYFLASYYLLPPIHSFRVESPVERWQQFLIVLTGVIISAVNEALHRSRRRADVAVRKYQKAEDALVQAGALQRASEARYSTLFEYAPDGIVIADLDSYYLDANDSICRMLGYTRGELIGMHASQIVVESEVPHIGSALHVIKGKSKYRREWQFRRKDGSVFDADVIATQMPDGNLLGMIRDVSDRRRADEQTANALRELTAAKAAIDEHAIVAMTNLKGKITYVNDKFCAISQYSREELLGKDHRIINSKFHPKEFIRNIWETIGNGRAWHGEIKNRAKDGTFYWVDTTIVPYLGEDGKPIQYIAIRADITKRKEFEQALQQKNIELEDASRMKSEFLANMSHELRTPLNAVIGFSEVLRDGLIGDLTEQQREFVGNIFSGGTHLLSLINDILDLSKIEAGKMTLELESVQLSSLLTQSLSIIKEKAASRRIGLRVDVADDLDDIQLDGRKVKQIVYNLLSNAVKFTLDGGQVTVHASHVSRAEVGKFAHAWTGRGFPLPGPDDEFAEFLRVSVTDSGIGISSEGLEQLFKPFSQIDSGLARQFEGTGLGLAMVKLLVELHGGTVAVESAVGQGSCFIVWLPLRRSEGGAITPAGTIPAPRLRELDQGRFALVVEGDFKAADLIRLHLEAEGFEVLHAASAEAALGLAEQQPLALITLDIILPNMDGWEFLSRIKQLPHLQRIPVVIISIAADRIKGFALGAAAVMQKPVSRQALHESLVDLGLLPLSPGRRAMSGREVPA